MHLALLLTYEAKQFYILTHSWRKGNLDMYVGSRIRKGRLPEDESALIEAVASYSIQNLFPDFTRHVGTKTGLQEDLHTSSVLKSRLGNEVEFERSLVALLVLGTT